MLAGADKIAGEAFGAFVEVDKDFVEVSDGFNLGVRGCVERVWAIGDSVIVDDGERKVKVIPKAVGVVRDGVNVGSAVGIELGFGVELD